PTGSEIENTDCDYTDVNVVLNIGQAPSQNADVIFTVEGSSTATPGLDFDLLTPTVTFPSGSTDDHNMVLRIYHDGFVEGDETISISFAVNRNGGDAVANTNADSFAFTINDDDVVPIVLQNSNLFFEDFEDTTGWVVIDADGDGNNWTILADQGWTPHQYTGNWAARFSGDNVPITPDNYLVSPAVSIPADLDTAMVSYIIGSADEAIYYKEHYSLYFTTDITSTATIQAGTVLENNREIPANGTENRSHNLISLAGQTGYFVVRHHNVTDQFILGLDSVSIDISQEAEVQTAVNTGTTNDFVRLNGTGTIYTSDAATDHIMLDITNNESFDYGCTDI